MVATNLHQLHVFVFACNTKNFCNSHSFSLFPSCWCFWTDWQGTVFIGHTSKCFCQHFVCSYDRCKWPGHVEFNTHLETASQAILVISEIVVLKISCLWAIFTSYQFAHTLYTKRLLI